MMYYKEWSSLVDLAVMMIDEIDLSVPGPSNNVEGSDVNYTSRLVSLSYNQQEELTETNTVSNDALFSPCIITRESPDTSITVPITGIFGNIEHKYQIDQQVLGTGHYGTVRECINRSTNQRFAVKSIRKNHSSVKPEDLVQEIRLLQDMRHQGIIRLVDVYEDVEFVHLVTDLCTGGELFDKIIKKKYNTSSSCKCFAEDEAARVIQQILAAVTYMHKRGIVHRDIKPENILYETADEDSPVKIIDFGLARKHYAGLDPPMNTIMGTPYYIAPEVLRRKYNKSCDLWSVGVVAYTLLCGYSPFKGASNDETLRTVSRGEYNFPSKDWKAISSDARHFVRQLLQMDPKKRMTADEALKHPWIVRHTRASEYMSDEISKEDMENGLRLSCRKLFSGPIANRNMRKSMFGI
eukprot:CAMPEP_0183717376 /NCGR_PEP_ID=MMETSP0737-20130205/11005_1 /TAXON_ID=385413 /ORGANISM="Thalassiosira miniscula, Strain CCMP1093" /LENGTH=408 /DNA_ID=CAMNT_0025946811 /DNA_START=69 /DNA_END=1295 /DNA_ORIENTATION=+